MGWISRIGPSVAAGSAALVPSWLRALAPPPAARSEAEPALLLAYATQTGVAEYHARDTAARLQRMGVAVRLVEFDVLSIELLASVPRMLLVVSTTYDGEAPDTADAFCDTCMHEPAPLEGLRYGLLSLGDSCYRQFCAFGRRLHAWLQASGAQASFAPVEVDDEDAAAIQEWHRQVSAWIGSLAGGVTRGNG
ncbi:MAG TPA: flavodoxin domain-containing protein [Frateuria sp.]|uniref:flavodoxin domain-containing protein n=1 Tax=Frateuria sp. TaxID=2211372 RepID=UPI002DEB3D2F|nr:flavodoxin domain-containing protein [Frateuria sp.]